jgi:hypothetical protein
MARDEGWTVARALRLAGRLLFPGVGIWWHVTPPGAFASAGEPQDTGASFAPGELDAWLREVLGDGGAGGDAREASTARRYLWLLPRRRTWSRDPALSRRDDA